jgi:hypothetical protein
LLPFAFGFQIFTGGNSSFCFTFTLGLISRHERSMASSFFLLFL